MFSHVLPSELKSKLQPRTEIKLKLQGLRWMPGTGKNRSVFGPDFKSLSLGQTLKVSLSSAQFWISPEHLIQVT